MDAADLTESVRSSNKTELSRLGSSKTLYAQTGGDLKTTPVLAAAADRTYHAAELLAGWAADGDDAVADGFAAMAETVRGHYEDIVAELEAHDPGSPSAIVTALQGFETATERLGGVLGWALVARKESSQRSGYFTGQADPTTASLFREMGGDYDDLVAAAGDLLETLCADPEDWEAAERAATAGIQAAYESYVETLEGLGVNPKPVC
jgi:hypothetical protein